MKKMCYLLTMGLLAGSLTVPVFAASDADSASDKKWVIATDTVFKPFEYTDDDELVDDTWNHGADCLWKYNTDHGTRIWKTKTSRCFHLSGINRQDTCTDDLCHISTTVKGEADSTGLECCKCEIKSYHIVQAVRNTEINKICQNDHWDTADYVNKNRGYDPACFVFQYT